MTRQSPPNVPSSHFFQKHKSHNDSYITPKEGFDNAFGGQAWSTIKMTNDLLETRVYTSIFEIFSIGDAGGFIEDDNLIFEVKGDVHYKILTFGHDKIDNRYTKFYIQFTSDGQPGSITFELSYYGIQFDKNIKVLFYSRVVKGRETTDFNHNIFYVSDVQDNHQILYFENLIMNGNKIKGLGDPVSDTDVTNKKYVDIAIADKASK